MRHSVSISRRGRAVVAAICAVLAAVGLVTAGGAAAQPIAPTGITAAAMTSNTGLGGSVPAVLAAVGTPITLNVALLPAGATFSKTTNLTVSASLASGGKAHGSFSPSTLPFPAGTNSASFVISYSAVDNGVIATVSGPKVKGTTLTPGSTSAFDVLKELTITSTSDPSWQTGLSIGSNGCTAATTESECGTVFLTNGAASPNGALSLGACTAGLDCMAGSQIVQFIADLGSDYTPQAPVTMIIRCVKSLCKGGGVNSYTVHASFSASGPLSTTVAPCVSKGVALDAAGNPYCTDYVQSHRDNAGDVLLYVLFTKDFRAST